MRHPHHQATDHKETQAPFRHQQSDSRRGKSETVYQEVVEPWNNKCEEDDVGHWSNREEETGLPKMSASNSTRTDLRTDDGK